EKDETGKDVDLHLYRSMIGALMYLTASRPDIMFAVCACARHQVTPKECHLHAVKRIFRLAFCDYHNMIAILEKYEHNVDFHQIVDFVEAFHIRVETSDAETKILVTVDGKPRTISESSIRRNLKLKDEAGISSLQDEELFKNLTLMGLANTLMDKENPWGKDRISKDVDLHLYRSMIGSLMYLTASRPDIMFAVCACARHQILGGRLISWQCKKQINVATSTTEAEYVAAASGCGQVLWIQLLDYGDVSQGEAYPTDSGFIAGQDMATIAKSFTLPYDLAPRVTFPATVKGSMQQTILELTALCTSLQRQLFELTDKFQAQKGRSMDEGEATTERVSDDTKEMATILTSMDVETVLASGVVDVPTGSGSIPNASIIAEGSVPTGSEEVPTASLVFATATVVTLVIRRKGKEIKRKGLNLEQESAKKQKTSEEVPEEAMSPEEVKEMMQLVPIEEFYVEALQVKHPIIDWKVYTEGQRSYWKITRMYEPDKEDQLWTHTQNFMHDLVDWKLYDTRGVHHVTSKDKEIFMLVEKDYPLRKGLALVMICYKLQVENFSQMANDLVLKVYKIANSLRQQGD
nr:hypothetical protein [Tanacetum cinerariifolium]